MFFLNFLNNFLPSFIFLFINFIISLQLSNSISKKKYFTLNFFNIFICFVSVDFIVISFFNLINLTFLSLYFITFIILFKIFIIFKYIKFLKLDCLYQFFISNSVYNFIILIFFLLSILPLSDADSIASHLVVSKNLYQTGKLNFNENINIESMLYYGNEILLQLSYILKSDNFGSQLNFFSLLVFLITFNENKNFKKIVFSIPLIVFFISTQKLQLFYGLIFLSIFILSNRYILKQKIDLFIILYLLLFYCSGKVNYIIFAFIFFIYFSYKNINYLKYIILFSLIGFVIFLSPIFLLNFSEIGNPLPPFFDNYFENRESFKAFETSLRSNEGWYLSVDLLNIIKPFFPTNIASLTAGFGLIFLFLILDFKQQRKINYFPYILIFLIILTGQMLPRYYLEAFLILAFYTNFSKKIKFLTYLQSLVIFTFTLIFIIISYFEIVKNNFYKEAFQKRFSYSYYNAKNLEKIDYRVLAFNLDRGSIFFNENIYTMRLINSLNLLKNNKEKIVIDFLKKNKIQHLIHMENDNFVLKCLKVKRIDEIYSKVAIRNFLRKENPVKHNISRILAINNECR